MHVGKVNLSSGLTIDIDYKQKRGLVQLELGDNGSHVAWLTSHKDTPRQLLEVIDNVRARVAALLPAAQRDATVEEVLVALDRTSEEATLVRATQLCERLKGTPLRTDVPRHKAVLVAVMDARDAEGQDIARRQQGKLDAAPAFRNLNYADLPEDMQVLLFQFLEDRGYTFEIPDLDKVTVPIYDLEIAPVVADIKQTMREWGAKWWDERGPAHVASFAEAMYANTSLPPVVMGSDGWMDGRHRLLAADMIGTSHLPAIDFTQWVKELAAAAVIALESEEDPEPEI